MHHLTLFLLLVAAYVLLIALEPPDEKQHQQSDHRPFRDDWQALLRFIGLSRHETNSKLTPIRVEQEKRFRQCPSRQAGAAPPPLVRRRMD